MRTDICSTQNNPLVTQDLLTWITPIQLVSQVRLCQNGLDHVLHYLQEKMGVFE